MNASPSIFQRKFFQAIAAAVIVWIMLIVVPDGFFAPLRSVLAPIVTPLQGFFSWVAFETSDLFRFLRSVGELKEENARLIQENRRLDYDAALLAELSEENRRLREAAGLELSQQGKKLMAEVVSRDTRDTGASLTINRGKLAGVRVGLPVVIGSGQLVGRIAAVELTSARVHLLSHPDSAIASRIAGTSTQGVIRGDHSLGLIFDLALSGEKLEPGLRLVTTGLGDGLPKDLFIGTIGTVRPSADRLFQQAVVVTDATENDIRFVTVILPEA